MSIDENSSPEMSIVIPVIDECDNLMSFLPELQVTLQDMSIRAEILVVDGGSTDGTQAVAERLGARVVRQIGRGYGSALMTGFAEAQGQYVVTLDGDLSHPPGVLAELWGARETAELVVASRYVRGAGAEMPLSRRVLSGLLNRVYRRALSVPVKDLSSGYRLYNRKVLTQLKPLARDFDILEELLIRVQTEGWRIREVPFNYRPRGSGASHARLLRLGKAFAGTLLRMWRLRNSIESADYDYRAYYSPIIIQRYWQRHRYQLVRSMLEPGAILDIGCGSSKIILDLPEAYGLDILIRKLRFLKSKSHRRLVQASCFSLPFKEASFEVVISSQVIEHIPDDPAVMSEMTRVLKPGGILILGTPDYGRWTWLVTEWFYGKLLPGAYAEEHITHFTRSSLRSRLETAGYTVLDCQYVGFSEMILKARKGSRP